MAEREAEDEEQGARVRGVPHVRVEARGDEAVLGVQGEVEGEERAEGAEAVEADIGPQGDCEDAEEEGRGQAEEICGGWRSERADQGGEGEGGR